MRRPPDNMLVLKDLEHSDRQLKTAASSALKGSEINDMTAD